MALILREEEKRRADWRSSSGKSCFCFLPRSLAHYLVLIAAASMLLTESDLAPCPVFLKTYCFKTVTGKPALPVQLDVWVKQTSVCERCVYVCERERERERERESETSNSTSLILLLWPTFPLSPPTFVLSKQLNQYSRIHINSTFFGVSSS